MSKEYIQALDDLFGLVAFQGSFEKAQKYFDIIEQALIKAQEQEKVLKKYKKTLEIIIEKEVNIRHFIGEIKMLGKKFTYEFYLLEFHNYHYFVKEENKLTPEEFDLLKEVVRMSKGLEALKIIDNKTTIRYVYEKEYNTIEKELKALEIIKEKVIPLVSIEKDAVWDNELYMHINITEEEFELLKEVLTSD